MAVEVVFGGGRRLPRIYSPPEVEKKPLLEDNILLMSREEFYAWLDKNNAKALPISLTIKRYKEGFYEDHRPRL